MNGGMFTVKLLNKFIDSRFFFFFTLSVMYSAKVSANCTGLYCFCTFFNL